MFPRVSFKEVSLLYSTQNIERYNEIVSKFQSIFKQKPDFIARAPGRVNIIGQHIDYEGYGVLPAAIEKDCLIAVKKNKSQDVFVHHVNSDLYPSQTLPTDPQTKIQFINNYLKYFRAGYRAGVKKLPKETLTGLQIVISGNVPPAAGLSSSSSLCVCSALASLHANSGDQGPLKQGDKQSFIQTVIVGQRQTGTASGGMDQSISVLGQQNSCLYIQFNPIRCQPIRLPEGSRFVIMNSLVQSAKLQTAVFRYNKRVCQCRIAVLILARRLGFPGSPKILRQLQQWSHLPLNQLATLVDVFIQRHDFSQQQIESLLGRQLNQILSDIPLFNQVIKANKIYKIWQAAKHVFEQAYRVIQFTNVCNSNLLPKDKQILLGKLMNQSQRSCHELYDCSCPQIDQICSLALKKGALGSRLTGAGWGGCTVSLVDENKAHQFIQSMIQQYYNTKPHLQTIIKQLGIQNMVFQSKPSQGACIITDL